MIDEQKVWEHLLGFYPELKKKFRNPFRNDKNPGAYLIHTGKRIVLCDFASQEWHLCDCVKVYAKLNNLDPKQAFKELNKQFILLADVKVQEYKREEKEVTAVCVPVYKDWQSKELDYWYKRGVTCLDNIFPIKGYYNSKGIYKDTSYTLGFTYRFNRGFKMYFPFSKRLKFISQCAGSDVWHLTQGSSFLLIVKASKDFKVAEGIIKRNRLRIDLIHLQGETMPNFSLPLNSDIYKSYKKTIAVFDNDKAGIENALKFTKLLDMETVLVPEGKDVDDFYILKGEIEVKDWIISLSDPYLN